MAEQIGWPGKFPHRMRNRIRRQGMCESFRSAVAEGLAKKRLELSHDGSVCMLYMVTFTINNNPSFVSIYTIHTDPMGMFTFVSLVACDDDINAHPM